MSQEEDNHEGVNANGTTLETAAFSDYEAAAKCIEVVIDQAASAGGSNDSLADFQRILDRYLELPSLLDQHLEHMTSRLSHSAILTMENTTDIGAIFSSTTLPRTLSALYYLSKVRGRKRVQKFLPHEVRNLDPILETLHALDTTNSTIGATQGNESSNAEGTQLWHSEYMLWNWMGILSLVPFNCSVVVDAKRISDLIELAKNKLGEAGPTREMAAACLAAWLSRPDLETELDRFQLWAIDKLQNIASTPSEVFRTMGVLQTLVTILKVSKADREGLKSFVVPLCPSVLEISRANPSNLLLRKYLVKWWTRCGTVYLPPRVLAWRYQRGRRSLKDNLQGKTANGSQGTSSGIQETELNHEDQHEFFLVPDSVEEAMGEVIKGLTDPSTVVRWSSAKGIGRITERLPAICANDVLDALLGLFEDGEKDNDWHGACLAIAELSRRGLLLPDRLEKVVPKIVEAIHYDVPRRQTSVGAHVRDAASYSCWAMARAYAPSVLKPFALQLSQSVVLAFLFDREVNCRRAASAAFQEFVGRQGTNNFKHGISILTTADYFSLGTRKDAYSGIAAHVAQFDEYRRPIIDHLLGTKLFHWDPAIRSLASTSLSGLVPLDAEYFSSTIIPSLLESSLDERNVQRRHGSVLGLSEVTLAFGHMKGDAETFEGLLSSDTLMSISALVPVIEKKRLYRGKGGEQMRWAVCRLIECLAIARIPLTVPQQVRLLDSIDACIPHPNEAVQQQAGKGLSALMHNYFPVSSKGPSDRLQKRVIDKYVKELKTSVNPAATRGFSMALGCLPAKLLAPSSKVLDLSLAVLCRMSRPDATLGNEKDAETRRNTLVALTRICETVRLQPDLTSTNCVVGLTPKQVGHVFTALFRGLNDYNMERRGDVGSLSRIAAMRGLVSLASVATDCPGLLDSFFSPETCTRLIGGLCKQLAEKLDAVREVAGQCLSEILTLTSPQLPYIPHRVDLINAFALAHGADTDRSAKPDTNWTDPALTFPMVVSALHCDGLFDYLVSGLVISVGCLTQNVSKHAADALVEWVKNAAGDKIDMLGKALLGLFDKHKREGRVILPLLKTISLLMNRMCIDRLIEDRSFSMGLLVRLRDEERGCTDVHRLNAIGDVTLGILSGAESSKDALTFACEFLQHPFPRVRRVAAENLYVRLLENPDFAEEHSAIALLLSNPWDSENSEDKIREMAVDVANALQVTLP